MYVKLAGIQQVFNRDSAGNDGPSDFDEILTQGADRHPLSKKLCQMPRNATGRPKNAKNGMPPGQNRPSLENAFIAFRRLS